MSEKYINIVEMDFGLSAEVSIGVSDKTMCIHALSSDLENYFKYREYGESIKSITIGLICVAPEFEFFSRVRKLRYTEYKKYEQEGFEVVEDRVLSYDLKLDYNTFKSNTLRENQKFIGKEILNSLSYLDSIPRKIKDFDKERFKDDLIEYFRSNGFLDQDSWDSTYTDHLGSILTVTNASGLVEAEQSFDAWGRRRDVTTWGLMAPTAVTGLPVWLYWGYTGHEHLDQFGLINMNGRLYDPVLGRMLSPDNYVPDPFFSQDYNRYTYARNNPLVYVDPDGNIPESSLCRGCHYRGSAESYE